MVQTCGANINKWHDLFSNALLKRILIHGSVHASQSIWNFDAKIFRKGNTHHAITCVDLVTQTHHFDIAMTIDRVTNADHWICKIDKPRVRASLFHIVRDLHDGTDIARRVREAAGPAIL